MKIALTTKRSIRKILIRSQLTHATAKESRSSPHEIALRKGSITLVPHSEGAVLVCMGSMFATLAVVVKGADYLHMESANKRI